MSGAIDLEQGGVNGDTVGEIRQIQAENTTDLQKGQG